jgi:chemotaxis protein MotB
MLARRNKEIQKTTNRNLWLTTYSDLVTLILCFFVLLFSFSEIDVKRFKAIIRSFQSAAGMAQEQLIDRAEVSDGLLGKWDQLESLESIFSQLKKYVGDNNLEATIVLAIEERGLLIRFTDQVLFDSGSSDIKPDAQRVLKDIGDILYQSGRFVRVEGHTDNVPINTLLFPSNWELSTARAVNVVKFFIEQTGFWPNRLSAAGYSEYHPIADNDNEKGRHRNRRVDVVVLRSNYAKEEPNY